MYRDNCVSHIVLIYSISCFLPNRTDVTMETTFCYYFDLQQRAGLHSDHSWQRVLWPVYSSSPGESCYALPASASSELLPVSRHLHQVWRPLSRGLAPAACGDCLCYVPEIKVEIMNWKFLPFYLHLFK